MHRLYIIVVIMLGVCYPAQAQLSSYHDRALAPVTVLGVPQPVAAPIPYGQVRVCNTPASGSPCTPVASIFDLLGNALSVVGGNFGQLTTDVTGQFSFQCNPGTYQVQVAASASNTPQLTYQISCPTSVGGNGNVTVTGNLTVSGTGTVSKLNNVFYVDGTTYPLTVAGIIACVNAAAAANGGTGGICHADAVQGAVSNSTAFTVGTGSGNSVTLYLGCPLRLTTSATISVQVNSAIIGCPASTTDGNAVTLSPTVITQANSANLACVVDFVGNLSFGQDFLVDGNKANNATVTNDGICIHNGRVTMMRVASARSQRHGFHVISTGLTNQAGTFKGFGINAISNSGSGLRCDASTDMYISPHSEFENNGVWGIDNFDCSGMRVEGPTDIGGNGPTGAHADSAGGGIQIQGISTGWKAVNNHLLGIIFGNNLGDDIFIEGGCSDSLATLCSRGHEITGNIAIGEGASGTSNTFDWLKIQDSSANTIGINSVRSGGQGGITYKYGIEFQAPNRAELNDAVTGLNIDGTFGTGYILPAANTSCANNLDPANLCSWKIPSGFAWASSGIPIAGATSGTMTIIAPATGGGMQTGASGTGTIADNVQAVTLRQSLHISDQGSVCTNGELALSANWAATGSATVTGVAGNGQTCSWTITTGTTTGANPTVTDTLTNALPAATTRCWMFLEYGPASTHTAAAGEGFAQTTLSSTAPVFTFNGTPTAAGKTYLVVRTCGP